MNLSKIFFWIKKKQGPWSHTMPSTNFDQKLMKKIRSNFIPSWSQLKYLKNFLKKSEKITIDVAAAIFFLAAISWGLVWFITNNTVIPASGGDYSEAVIGQPKYINPIFASANDVDADLSSLIYSGLFQYNVDQKLLPDLASDYSVSADGKIYNINLRRDVKWSDGEPLTADDVIYTIETISDPEIGSPLLAAFQSVQVEKTGDYSIRFTLKDPFAPFLGALTVGILPQHIWGNIPPAAVRLAKTNLQPIGSGPWKFGKLTKDNSGNIQNYSLDRNETYYRNIPHLKTLTFKFYTDYTQAAGALKSQDVTAISFLPNDLTNKVVGKNFKLHKLELPQYTAIFFNQDSATILKDDDLRLALNLAIDKSKILTEALGNNGETINSPILKGNIGYNPDISFPEFNIQKANEVLDKAWKKVEPEDFFKMRYEPALKARLSEADELRKNISTSTTATAGQAEQTSTTPEQLAKERQRIEKEVSDSIRQDMDADQSFYRKNKNNEILEIILTTADTAEYQNVADAIAKMWRAIGVKTKIQITNNTQINKDILRDRNYQALLYGEIVGGDPDPFPFWHSSQVSYPGLNLSMFIDRSVDKILEDARATTSEKTRGDLYEKFQKTLAKEIPAIFIYTPTYNFVVSKEIKGITIKQIFSPADRFNDLGNWYIKTKRKWGKS